MTEKEAYDLSLRIVDLLKPTNVKDGIVVLLGVITYAEFVHEDGTVRPLYPSEVAELYRDLLHTLNTRRRKENL